MESHHHINVFASSFWDKIQLAEYLDICILFYCFDLLFYVYCLIRNTEVVPRA